LTVEFLDPFAWPHLPDAPSVFRVSECLKRGVYFWTVPTPEGHLVYDVEESGRSFQMRLLAHSKEHAAGFDHDYCQEEFVSVLESVYQQDDRAAFRRWLPERSEQERSPSGQKGHSKNPDGLALLRIERQVCLDSIWYLEPLRRQRRIVTSCSASCHRRCLGISGNPVASFGRGQQTWNCCQHPTGSNLGSFLCYIGDSCRHLHESAVPAVWERHPANKPD